jgi:hypothetical protein
MTTKVRYSLAALAMAGMVGLNSFAEDRCAGAAVPPALPAAMKDRDPEFIASTCVSTEPEGQRLWIVGYGGPPDGFAILTDKSGRAVSTIAVGLPESWTLKRIDSDAAVVVVEAVTGTGTGVRQDDFHVLSIERGKLKELWKGLSYRRDSAPGRGRSTESSYALRVDTTKEGREVILHRVRIGSAKRSETTVIPLSR